METGIKMYGNEGSGSCSKPIDENTKAAIKRCCLELEEFNKLECDEDYRIARGYSWKQQERMTEMRSIIYAYAELFSAKIGHRLLPVTAVNYADRFLSKYNLPVRQGFRLRDNLKFFAFTCVALAGDCVVRNFNLRNYTESNNVAEPHEVLEMGNEIKRCLNDKMRPLVGLEPLRHLLTLVEIDNKQHLPVIALQYMVVGLHKDIKFTNFKLLVVAASAILATAQALLPSSMCSDFYNRLKSAVLPEMDLEFCSSRISEHAVFDQILYSGKPPMVATNVDVKGKGKGSPVKESSESKEETLFRLRENWKTEQEFWNVKGFDLGSLT